METQLFCVFTLSVCGCECVWLCVSAPAIIIIDRISICCAFFMPRLQWNPFGAASSGGVNDNCAASCGRIGYIVDDFTNALNDIALPFASQPVSQWREGALFGLSKYLLKWQQLNAYEMVITHTPHCAAEGSAATYCRSFILLIASVGERHWARFIKQLDRKSAHRQSSAQLAVLAVARPNSQDVAVFVISIINFGPLSWVLR